MSNLQVFNFDSHDIRIILIDGVEWWVGKDVAQALGYVDPFHAISNHVDVEDILCDAGQNNQHGLSYQTRLINESGLYALIFGSKLESAKAFKRWVTSEVLPTIRKTGRYEVPQPEPKKQLDAPLIDYVNKIQELSTTFAQVQPRLAQVLTDHLVNVVLDTGNKLPHTEPKLQGVVEIAEDMGYKVRDLGQRSSLGKHVAKQFRYLAVSEKRLCNGRSTTVNCYPNTPEIRDCIKQFFS